MVLSDALLIHDLRSGAYKMISAGGKYGRTTESAYKDLNTYGRKESTMLTIYEVSVETSNRESHLSKTTDTYR